MHLKRNISKLDKFNYENIYVDRLAAEAKWLKDAAVQRCDNIEYFLRKKSINPSSMKDFCLMNCITRKKHGLPPQPTKFFDNLFIHVL